ncbi:MAG: SurA N-terminal domain-containing protein [Victivallaceae bacterium]|nr:SurA N-terminal domain-containing protein [Victivallaceae bacterium]
MVIRKMNSVFHRHGRWLFAIITLVIIFTFVGFLTPGFRSLFVREGHEALVGTVFGQEVTYAEMRQQAKLDQLAMALSYGQPLNSNISERIWENAFSSLGQIAAAKKCGIRVSDKQVADYIAKLPTLKGTDGKLDLQKYKDKLKEVRKNGYSATDLDTAIRLLLLRQAYNAQVMNNVIITDNELKSFYNFFLEKTTVKMAEFKAADFIGKVKLSDQDIETYFAANHGRFILPAEYRAELIAFPLKNFAAAAAKQVTEERLKEFYAANKADFKTAKGKLQPLSKVKKQVTARLVKSLSSELALNAAQVFATELYDMLDEVDATEQYKTFADKVKSKKIASIKTAWFKSNEVKIGDVESAMLVKQITLIERELPISDAVVTEDAVYVAYLLDKKESRPAELKEVKAQVIKELKNLKSIALARETAGKIALKIAQSKAPGKLIAAKVYGFKAVEPFTRRNLPYGPNAGAIVQESEKLAVGKASMPIDTARGALIIYVEKRTSPDSKNFAKQEQLIRSYYRSMKVRAAQSSSANWWRSNCKFLENKKK